MDCMPSLPRSANPEHNLDAWDFGTSDDSDRVDEELSRPLPQSTWEWERRGRGEQQGPGKEIFLAVATVSGDDFVIKLTLLHS
jgi:hypothetical protein